MSSLDDFPDEVNELLARLSQTIVDYIDERQKIHPNTLQMVVYNASAQLATHSIVYMAQNVFGEEKFTDKYGDEVLNEILNLADRRMKELSKKFDVGLRNMRWGSGSTEGEKQP